MTEESKHLAPNPEAVQIALISMLESRPRWDEQPELGTIITEDDGMVRTEAIPIPDTVWRNAEDPKLLLARLARTLRQPEGSLDKQLAKGLRAAIPSGLCGMYLRVEGWTLPGKDLQKLHGEHQATGRPMPRFEKNPRRIELRVVNAIDSAGWRYWAQQTRGQRGTAGFYENELADTRIEGTIPRELWSILETLTPGAERRREPPKGFIPDTFGGKN